MKNKFNYLLKKLVIKLKILFNSASIVYGENINWVEVSKTSEWIKYLDADSVDTKGKKIIELKTKYLKISTNNSNQIEENIYSMRINCLTSKFKDISVNGKKILNAKWEDPNGYKLFNDLIFDSYKNV